MEPWEPRRDWLIGHCGKTEREAEVVSWVELRALLKGRDEREYGEWVRARFIAHTIYLHIPVFGKGVRKEKDPRRFFPLPGDKEDDKPTVVRVTKKQMARLDETMKKIGLL